jgi:hypothetical protein
MGARPLEQVDPLLMENKHKHLEFIQAAVNRMASNLFLLKGWTITLIAAVFILGAEGSRARTTGTSYWPTFRL